MSELDYKFRIGAKYINLLNVFNIESFLRDNLGLTGLSSANINSGWVSMSDVGSAINIFMHVPRKVIDISEVNEEIKVENNVGRRVLNNGT